MPRYLCFPIRLVGCVLVIIFFLFVSPRLLHALVINEVLPNPIGDDKQGEWVEIYNSDSESINLNGYRLVDEKNNEMLIDTDRVDGSTVINGSGFLIIRRNGHSTFSLNNDSDQIYLYDLTSSDSLDTFTYNGSTENKSWGRIPDGGSVYTEVLESTPGSSNKEPTSETPTPTPTANTQSTDAKYKINDVKDKNGNTLSSVKVYVDDVYTNHYAPEELTFCDGCKCNNADCGFGSHTIKLEKSGYKSWSETKDMNTGDNHEANPVLESESTPAPTKTATPTAKPKKTSTPTPKLKTPVPLPTLESEEYSEGGFVLGMGDDSSESTQEEGNNGSGGKVSPYAIIFIVGGLGAFGAAGYAFSKNRKKTEKNDSTKKEAGKEEE